MDEPGRGTQPWPRLRLLWLTMAVGCIHFPPSRTLVTVEPRASRLVFHDVSVFAATDADEVAHQDVVVDQGRIAAIQPTGPLDRYAGARIIESSGKTLLPGLIDIHAHPTGSGAPFYRLEVPDPERNLQAHLYVGVTTLADPGVDPEAIAKLIDAIRKGDIAGPHIYYAGRMITARDGYPPSMLRILMPWPLAGIASDSFTVQVGSAEEARAAAQANLRAGASFLKVAVTRLPDAHTPRLEEEEIAAVVDEAHKAHTRVVAHIDAADDALLCARSGVEGLWHDVQLDRLTPQQVQDIASRVPVMVPTLTTFDALDRLYEGKVDLSPLLSATESPGLVQSVYDAPQHVGDIPSSLRAWMERLHANHEGRRANVRALHDAGMTTLVGTDANGAPGSFPANYPAEMAALHEAGLSTREVLLGARVRAAHFLEKDPDFGTIEAGRRADLVLVDGDPVADMTAMFHIAAVTLEGRLVERHPGFDAR